jgi:hypothetical protein
MFPNLDVMGESALGRVILKKVFEVFGIQHRIIDDTNVEPSWVFEG